MNYVTYMGNRDMTTVMAAATLPVAYMEENGQFYNEMHGYVQEMDGSYMKDSILGISEDHALGLAIEKYNAHILNVSYEVRSLDMERLIEDSDQIAVEDDGKYLHIALDLKDLLEKSVRYLLLLKVETEEHGLVTYFSQLVYLGENHVQECLDFALEFHRMTIAKEREHQYLNYLEPNSSMDGSSLGYVNIHSRSGPITWGDMQIAQITDTKINFTELEADIASLEMKYQVENQDTGEVYEVREDIRMRYTSARMYLLAYERRADRILTVGKQLLEEDLTFQLGIQSGDPDYLKNEEENVLAFVQQGQLWCYDYGQNRLSLVYGFLDGDDARGQWPDHDFRLLDVEESGSMDFLIYGYMNRGQYEGRCGVLFCHYDALLNAVEEEFFLESNHPYEAVKEEVGVLSVANDRGDAWISYRGLVLQVDFVDCSVKVLAEDVQESGLKVSESGRLAAWTDGEGIIHLLNTQNGIENEIRSSTGELLQALGFMKEDFIYGIANRADIRIDVMGRQVVPMYRLTIRDHAGNQVREFDYTSKGKYVVGLSIDENRIDLSCISLLEDGGYEEALPEPITYTTEKQEPQLSLEIVRDAVKRNEYEFAYKGTVRDGSMRRPKVKLVVFENERTIFPEAEGTERFLAYAFNGSAEGFEFLSDAMVHAYDGMGTVWKGFRCFWERGNRKARTQVSGFEDLTTIDVEERSLATCLQLMLRTRQIYADVQQLMNEGMDVWKICRQELGEDACLLSGCTLDMVLYYVSRGVPVVAMRGEGEAVLIVGYDAQNIIVYMPGAETLTRMGRKDSNALFTEAGNLFYTYMP